MFTMIPYRNAMTNRPSANLFGDDFFRAFLGGERPVPGFRVDVQDQKDAYLLEAELPGLTRDNIRVELNDDVLTITAETDSGADEKKENGYIVRERRTGRMTRSFSVEGIRKEDIAAAYENGVLRVTLPKETEAEKENFRRIEIA